MSRRSQLPWEADTKGITIFREGEAETAEA